GNGTRKEQGDSGLARGSPPLARTPHFGIRRHDRCSPLTRHLADIKRSRLTTDDDVTLHIKSCASSG
ncbi:unnamed protein product, partial [Amoebophrya sp. A25]